MAKQTAPKRTDVHRPGAIIPADYSYVLSYIGGGADGFPPWNIANAIEVMRARRDAGGEVYGGIGHCGVCGACYRHGDLWRHNPSGDLVNLGHDCADKYSLLADRSEWEIEQDRQVDARATALIKRQKEDKRTAFLAKNPGLEDALTVDHRIIVDIRERFTRFCEISDKQIALVFKLADEVRNPKPPTPAEIMIPAPSGSRIDFEGVIVSVKVQEGDYGSTVKATVKITTAAGSWLAWGTLPNAIMEAAQHWNKPEGLTWYKGKRIALRATLKPGRDPHFAIMSRPAGKLVTEAPAQTEIEEPSAPDCDAHDRAMRRAE